MSIVPLFTDQPQVALVGVYRCGGSPLGWDWGSKRGVLGAFFGGGHSFDIILDGGETGLDNVFETVQV